MLPRLIVVVPLLLVLSLVCAPSAVGAERAYAVSAFELIEAVNALRASNGLPPYAINSILMYTAQNQADFMASTGQVTHSGPGGIGLTDRLLAAGYPLAGELSLGGFRAENITSGNDDMSAQSAVDRWSGDAPHLNTMLSPDLTEIGAGVSIANGRVYYVIDAARPTTSGAPQAATPLLGGGSAVPESEAQVSVVVISTQNAAGDVIHEVLSGQTLWQIAVSYDVRIDEIRLLNGLSDDFIYPGEKLLIRKGPLTVTGSPTHTSTIAPTASSTATVHKVTATVEVFATPTLAPEAPASTPMRSDNSTIMGVAIGILALALLGGGMFTWLGAVKKT